MRPNSVSDCLCPLQNWVVGRWHSRKEQAFAPVGTHFHQFVVPLMTPARKDCTYSKQICMKMPKVRTHRAVRDGRGSISGVDASRLMDAGLMDAGEASTPLDSSDAG